MKALATDGQGRLWLADAPMPVTGPYDCLVKIRSCLFCNTTDQHIVEKSFEFGIPYPALLGHESLGQVVECGAKVRNFQVGDWVTHPYACYPDETLGDFGSGWGGFAEFGKIRDHVAETADTGVEAPAFYRYMTKLPPALDPEKAGVLTVQRELCSAIRTLGDLRGRSFLVAGAGVAGLLSAVFLKAGGAKRVGVAARRNEALETARRLTPADEFLLLGAADAPPFEELIETTGSLQAMQDIAARFLTPGGAIHSYAIYAEMSQPDFADLLPSGHPHDRIDPDQLSAHEEVCGMLLDGSLTATGWITARYPLDGFAEAWAAVQNKKGLKTLIEMP